ncbi:axin interactor, dorsalization-associated protein-like [Styela clava]
MSKSEIEKLVGTWNQKFQQATDFDSWGQLVEAADEYSRLARMMKAATAVDQKTFDEDKSKIIRKVASCLEIRAKSLQMMKSPPDIDLAEIKKLLEVMKNLLKSKKPEIPEEINRQMKGLRLVTTPSPEPVSTNPEEESVTQLATSSFNSLLPRLIADQNETLVTVRIEKIGLKDASSHIDPFFVVSCKDIAGVDLCQSQKTPTAAKRDDTFLYFGIDVEIQICIEKMSRNSAIFFEMKHYKPNKRMTSLKCFAFMEQDELKPGPCVIELYKKPVDYRRKKLALLTSKPLYLHLNLTLHTG